MWNEPTMEELQRIPKLYCDEEIPLEEKLIYGHFFIGACDWFIAEYDGGDLFFGYANLNDDQSSPLTESTPPMPIKNTPPAI